MYEYQGALWQRRGCIRDRLMRRDDRAVLEWVASGSGADRCMTVGQVRDRAAQVEAEAEPRGYLLGQQAAFRALRERDGGSGHGALRPDVGSSGEGISGGEDGE